MHCTLPFVGPQVPDTPLLALHTVPVINAAFRQVPSLQTPTDIAHGSSTTHGLPSSGVNLHSETGPGLAVVVGGAGGTGDDGGSGTVSTTHTNGNFLQLPFAPSLLVHVSNF
jgi:hypothetical protein